MYFYLTTFKTATHLELSAILNIELLQNIITRVCFFAQLVIFHDLINSLAQLHRQPINANQSLEREIKCKLRTSFIVPLTAISRELHFTPLSRQSCSIFVSTFLVHFLINSLQRLRLCKSIFDTSLSCLRSKISLLSGTYVHGHLE